MSSSIPLTQAVTSGDERAVRTLLADGADINESTNGGQTALILAVIFGRTNLVRILVNAGADPQLRDNLGLNAIEWAKRRGLNEALAILTNSPTANILIERPTIDIQEEEQLVVEPARTTTTPTPAEKRETDSDDKSRRWLAGLKQRLDELESRRLNRNEPRPEPKRPETEPPPVTSVVPSETQKPEPVAAAEPARPEPRTRQPLVTHRPTVGRIITPPPEPPSTSTGKRKRCPKCNAIYNGELLSYCAHHIVPLVDVDEPIDSEPPRKNPPMFWIMVVITLSGSIVIGSLVTTYLYKSNQAAARSAVQKTTQKGSPELGAELTGKAVSLPDAQCPVSGPTPVTGTVTVHIMVDKKGQVYWARGAGGDWLMRGAATEAAMKSTFSPDKLRGREAEGTITYTFKP
ncbi:MAG TPA: ankyrin repeat domain-containing protein [Pyrinomonadaceae bacterium]|nr:ankyrin repeat domain-containing protein [Pyrinomonadaceae bacterium]